MVIPIGSRDIQVGISRGKQATFLVTMSCSPNIFHTVLARLHLKYIAGSLQLIKDSMHFEYLFVSAPNLFKKRGDFI